MSTQTAQVGQRRELTLAALQAYGQQILEPRYKFVEDLGVIDENSSYSIETNSVGEYMLVEVEGKNIALNFRRGTDTSKDTFLVGGFECVETFEYNGKTVEKGSRKVMVY